MADRRDWGPPKKRGRIPSRERNREVPVQEPDEDTGVEPSSAPAKPAPVELPQQHHYNTRGGHRPHTGYSPFSSSYQPPYPEDESSRRDELIVEAVLERKDRRQYLANIRSDKKRKRIALIHNKPEHERTDEEKDFLQKTNDQRLRKNQRTKERTLEQKAEAERILALPEDDRTFEEDKTLASYLAKLEHKNEADRLRRKRKKQEDRDGDTRSKKARHTIAAAGSAYWESEGDYRYPPPNPYPPVKPPPPPHPLDPTKHRRSAFVPVVAAQKNRPSRSDILHDERSYSPFQPPRHPSLLNQNEPDRYLNGGVHAPPFQDQLVLREHAAVPTKSSGHSFQTIQNAAKESSADPIKEKTKGVYIEDLKYPKRGRRRLPDMSDDAIKEREKVRRSLKNERSREKVERAKDRMAMILRKAECDRTEEENLFVERNERSRATKNALGRKRNRERKEKMESILAKPEGERTREETEWLASDLKKKKAKNLKDRTRRLRDKEDKIKNQNKIDMLDSVLEMEDLEEYPQDLLEDSD